MTNQPDDSPAAPRVHLVSLGCAKNQVDSERLLGALVEAGALVCADADDADTIVINTCGFIQPAKEESVETILEAARLKEEGACKRLVVVGCLVERHGAELRPELPEVDGWAGVGDVDAMVRACGLEPGGAAGRLRFGLPHVAYLRIADGCDNRCAYCAIPIIRGPLRSEAPEAVYAEAEALVADGAREVIVIAQDTTAYGAGRPGLPSLPELLEGVAARIGDAWLRLMYTHPAHFGDDLIDAYARIPNLLPYVDVPLQHLADPVLERMGRKITQADVLRLVERLRERVPDVVIRTTFLVGFPGETDADFRELLRRAEETAFDWAGGFEYSPEEGTPAEGMDGQVPPDVRADRLAELMELQQEITAAKNAARVGSELDVLVDGPSEDLPEALEARFYGQAPEVDGITLLFDTDAEPGQRLRVRVTDAEVYDLVAEEA